MYKPTHRNSTKLNPKLNFLNLAYIFEFSSLTNLTNICGSWSLSGTAEFMDQSRLNKRLTANKRAIVHAS